MLFTRTVAGAVLALIGVGALTIATPSAQRRRGGDSAAFGVPVATNTILESPDQYYGKLVTVSAGLEQVVSRTAFVVDQRKVVGGSEVQPAGMPILVIAPYLTGKLEPRKYLLVRGQLVRFDPQAISRVAAGYTLDLTPDLTARYAGRPVLVATSVLDSTYTELARKPVPPPSSDDLTLTAAMKSIAPAFAALRMAAQESKADVVTENALKLKPAFTQTEAVWDAVGQSPAAQLARDARAHADAIERAAAAGNWDAVKASATALNQVCGSCHGTYRERQDDGTFRMMPGSF
jgi:hypothetical protein